jgi:hypothetical protein
MEHFDQCEERNFALCEMNWAFIVRISKFANWRNLLLFPWSLCEDDIVVVLLIEIEEFVLNNNVVAVFEIVQSLVG